MSLRVNQPSRTIRRTFAITKPEDIGGGINNYRWHVANNEIPQALAATGIIVKGANI